MVTQCRDCPVLSQGTCGRGAAIPFCVVAHVWHERPFITRSPTFWVCEPLGGRCPDLQFFRERKRAGDGSRTHVLRLEAHESMLRDLRLNEKGQLYAVHTYPLLFPVVSLSLFDMARK